MSLDYPSEEYITALLQSNTPLSDTQVYLDYSASPLFLQSSLTSSLTSTTLYSNPHSRSPFSESTTLAIDRIRSRLLTELLGLSPQQTAEWDVIFTSGATASLKLVAQSFNWTAQESSYVYLASAAHTSLVGIRGEALQSGACVRPVSTPQELVRAAQQPSVKLIGYPSQCNASGRCLSLQLCGDLKRANEANVVLVDAAASLATSTLDLADIPLDEQPDFVTWSAYKTYNWPTGLGCLFVKKSTAARVLSRRGYFGGGSLDSMGVSHPYTMRPAFEPLHRTHEDGTLNFLSIVALDCVMNNFSQLFGGPLSSGKVSTHARRLTRLAARQMRQLRHANDQPVCRIYDEPFETYDNGHGTALAFTLLTSTGDPVGHVELDKLAAINDVHIRTGGLCNLGAISHCLGLTDEDLFEGHKVCWDENEFVRGKPSGLARISFGATSREVDVQRWIDFLGRFFVDSGVERGLAQSDMARALPYELADLCIYPIKSCAAMHIPPRTSWPLASRGLAYDREWAIVSLSTGSALSQKRWTKMACITATVDRSARVLKIVIPPGQHFDLSVDPPIGKELLDSKVCSEAVQTIRQSTSALDAALSTWIGTPCTLRRSLSSSGRHSHLNDSSQSSSDRVPIALSNESPFLVINQSSVEQLSTLAQTDISPDAFRANLVLKSPRAPPWVEESWTALKIGTQIFQVLSQCRRCQMINVDQRTGHKMKEPYNTLSQVKARNDKGHLCFGLHLRHTRDLSEEPFEISIGTSVQPVIGKF